MPSSFGASFSGCGDVPLSDIGVTVSLSDSLARFLNVGMGDLMSEPLMFCFCTSLVVGTSFGLDSLVLIDMMLILCEK